LSTVSISVSKVCLSVVVMLKNLDARYDFSLLFLKIYERLFMDELL
jgi:hypothetical protein